MRAMATLDVRIVASQIAQPKMACSVSTGVPRMETRDGMAPASEIFD